MKKLIILIVLKLNCLTILTSDKRDLKNNQNKIYQSVVIGFYNCENFYDIVDDPLTKDDEFTPEGDKHYTKTIYTKKLDNIAKAINSIGDNGVTDHNNTASILGLAEIENKYVLEDLIKHPLLKDRHLQIVHYDSKDERGIDVALIYNPAVLEVETSRAIYVKMSNNHNTRDILWVKGRIGGELIHIYVNHWPSRLGGKQKSEYGRIVAARVLKKHIDSIYKFEGLQKIVVMGDFNDDPTNKSIAVILEAKESIKDVGLYGIYNPFSKMYKKGIGSIVSRDNWSLFDQIMVNFPLLDKNQEGFFFNRASIQNTGFLVQQTGRYTGYPMRSWDGNNFSNGFSDHFPTYIQLLRRIKLSGKRLE